MVTWVTSTEVTLMLLFLLESIFSMVLHKLGAAQSFCLRTGWLHSLRVKKYIHGCDLIWILDHIIILESSCRVNGLCMYCWTIPCQIIHWLNTPNTTPPKFISHSCFIGFIQAWRPLSQISWAQWCVECLQKAPLYEICMWHISTCENQWLFCSLSKCVNINLSVELHRTTFLQCVVAVSSVWRHLKEIGSWIGAPDVQYIKDQHSVFPVPTYCCWFWLLYVAGIYRSYRQFMQ